MKSILILFTFLMLTSCVSLENICVGNVGMQRISGEVLYATPSRNQTRTVTINTESGIKRIYLVPLDQPLFNIPVCEHKGKLYWVMP
jgi:hypothetical protein